jgi:hypothetical protein
LSVRRYTVQRGDTRESIAKKFGIPWVAIYNHPSNGALRASSPGPVSVTEGGPLSPVGSDLWIPDKSDLAAPKGLPTGSAGRPPLVRIPHSTNVNESLLLSPANSSAGNSFELRIVPYLFLIAVQPEGSEGSADIAGRKNVRYVKWNPQDFEDFKRDSKKGAEKFWNKRFRLWPPDHYKHLRWPNGADGKLQSVVCTIEIKYVDSVGEASFRVKCFQRARGENSGSLDNMMWTDAIKDEPTHELRDKTGKIIPTKNLTLAHEVGHILGLDHPVCSGIESKCYGDGGEAWQIRNVMGAGSEVNRTNATPWLERIAHHTGVPMDEWTVHTLDEKENPLYL